MALTRFRGLRALILEETACDSYTKYGTHTELSSTIKSTIKEHPKVQRTNELQITLKQSDALTDYQRTEQVWRNFWELEDEDLIVPQTR